jgi:hypothetical protein
MKTKVLLIIVIGAVLALFAFLHLTGRAGRGMHQSSIGMLVPT